jgi:hypothetical protein
MKDSLVVPDGPQSVTGVPDNDLDFATGTSESPACPPVSAQVSIRRADATRRPTMDD